METLPTKVNKELSPDQIIFAQWLTTPEPRSPGTQQALARQLKVSKQTLCEWKKDTRILELEREYLYDTGKALVPKSLKVLKELLDSKNDMVRLKACETNLKLFSEGVKGIKTISIKELHQHFPMKEIIEGTIEGE